MDTTKYVELKTSGATPVDVFDTLMSDGATAVSSIRVIRGVFGLSLSEAVLAIGQDRIENANSARNDTTPNSMESPRLKRPADVVWLEVLSEADDPKRSECPFGFVWDVAVDEFRRFADDLCTKLSLNLTTDFDCSPDQAKVEMCPQIQDASYHGAVRLPAVCLINNEEWGYARICASNFGRLAGIVNEDGLKDEVRQTVRATLREHEYVWIPARVLEQPYTGACPGVNGIPDWQNRFFEEL